MKKNFLFTLISVFSLSLLLTSCGGGGDDGPTTPVGDTTPPVISMKTPAENAKLYIGSAIAFKADFSDNEALASYKIDIHFEHAGGHSIKGDLPSLRGVEAEMAFSFNKTWTITGKTFTAEQAIDVPMTVTDPSDNSQKQTKPGKYHMVIYLLDKAGNETILVRNITLAKVGS